MNHPASWFSPSISTLTLPSPRQVESLARAVVAHERLSLQDLPRCRREVRLQLALTRRAVRAPVRMVATRETPRSTPDATTVPAAVPAVAASG